MIAKTESALAKSLRVSRAALADWRKRYESAPRSRDVSEWEAFIAENGLGDRAPKRVGMPKGLRAFVEDRIAEGELAFGAAEIAIWQADPKLGEQFKAARKGIVPAAFRMWRIAQTKL